MNNGNVLYCGDREPLPDGYADYDTRYNCLKKGVGVGINIGERGGNRNYRRRGRGMTTGFFSTKWGYITIGLIILLLVVIFFLILFLYLR